MYLNFSDIPGHQNLFLDYLYEFENVRRFYKKNFRDIDEYPHFFKMVSDDEDVPRTQLSEILKSQYSNYKPSNQTMININALANKKTLTVVTGQQLGILGGPLYTFYKIFTAIKLCSELKTKFDEYNFVPVFWLEGEDHDFEEVRFLSVLNQSNQIEKVYYDDGLPPELNRGKIANIRFKESINKFFEDFNSHLRETEFTQPILNLLSGSYYEGASFLSAFKNLLFELFDEYGLIILDPTQKELKKLLTPIFENELMNYHEHSTYILQQSAELEEYYHAQVKVKPINLFLEEEDGRYLIEPAEELFRLKGKRKKYSLEELKEILNSAPERFSPNVLLRPICQDYLLPTAFYVGGPGEISYFAQVIPLYEFFGINQPYIYPRSSVTIIEKSVQKILEKYEIGFKDLLIGENTLNTRIIHSIAEIDLDSEFDKFKQEINLSCDSLKEKLFAVDPGLSDPTEKTREKFLQLADGLKMKASAGQAQKHDTAIRQIEKTRNTLLPEGILQERVLNFTYLANKYGLDIIKWLMNEIALGKFEHQIIEL